MDDLPCISRKGDRDCRHAAGLHHQQQRPSIQKRDGRMIRLAQVRILAAEIRPEHRQLGIDECAGQGR